VGVVGHEHWLYEELTAQENLAFYGRMYGVRDLGRRTLDVLQMTGMESYARLQVRSLSHGLCRRLALARALLHRPRVLLLDEPEAGLDQVAVGLLDRALAQQQAAGVSVVVTTHDLDWGLARTQRAIVMRQGRVVYDSAGQRPDPAVITASYRQAMEAVP
jgi:heme exporter protein A